MRRIPGVLGTRTGFMGGTLPNPTYHQVCQKMTGHAETVEVVYDTRRLSTRDLLREFFLLHDFTRDRRSGGGQYRSAIFTDPSGDWSGEQEGTARNLMALLQESGLSPSTELHTGGIFYAADCRHQQYCSARGIVPKRLDSARIKEILTN